MWSTILGASSLLGAAAFTACAANITLIELMARAVGRSLPEHREWRAMCRRIPHRMLAPAAVSVLAALIVSAYLDDDRWQVGAAFMIGAICYTLDAIVPAGTVLNTIDPSRAATLHLTRARFKSFAIKHYPLLALGVGALVAFAWAFAAQLAS
jgi:hypothetical protein